MPGYLQRRDMTRMRDTSQIPDSASTALIYREYECFSQDGSGTVVALHDKGSDISSFEGYSRALTGSFHVIALQAWRPVIPRILRPEDHAGYCWYLDYPNDHPEPATFGDSLWLVEQFLYGLLRRQSLARPVILFGHGQGAAIALTLSLVLPDLLGGVVALDGRLPKIRGWAPPVLAKFALPVLMLVSRRQPASSSADTTLSELSDRGYEVTHRLLPERAPTEARVVDEISAWLSRCA